MLKSSEAQFAQAHACNLMACIELSNDNIPEAQKYAVKTCEIDPRLIDYFYQDEGFSPLWPVLEPLKKKLG